MVLFFCWYSSALTVNVWSVDPLVWTDLYWNQKATIRLYELFFIYESTYDVIKHSFTAKPLFLKLVSGRYSIVYVNLLFKSLHYPVTWQVNNKRESPTCVLNIQLRIVSKQRGQIPVMRFSTRAIFILSMIFHYRFFMSAKRPAKAITGERDSETGIHDTRK